MVERVEANETIEQAPRRRGLPISRQFTAGGKNPYDSVSWTKRTSRITNPDGSVVFEMKDAEIPVDLVAGRHRHHGLQVLPQGGRAADWTRMASRSRRRRQPGHRPGASARQVIHRLAGCWREWGEKYGYFATTEDAQAFYDELAYMLVNQMAAPNSPQWFNTGLNFAYGITGPAQGHYYVDPAPARFELSEDAYTHPQPHACFIQSVDDDLVDEGGIMDLWVREARLFKYGSGTGTNFSTSAARAKSSPAAAPAPV